jgi:N-hydroxyarylamine O-acetyltransferase
VTTLSPATTEAVLTSLGFSVAPRPDLDGLNAIYDAWCRQVPFDNVIKRIHLASRNPAPLPNGEPEAFFASYLRHGTGGTCWPSSGGLHALLEAVGFDARRGSAAMRDDLSGPIHTHGTVLVRLDAIDYWVDTSMLTGHVFAVRPGEETRLEDPLHAVRVEPVGEMWRVWWTHPFLPETLGCLLLDDDVTGEHYLARYEWSRQMSPFNLSLHLTRNVDGARVTVAFDQRFRRTVEGVTSSPLGTDRDRVLVEELGYSEEIVAALPADDPDPRARH